MFSHFIARGNLPVTAYVGAGYERDPAAAHALMRLPRIAARIEELKPFYHEKYRSRKPSNAGLQPFEEEKDAEA
ncbi:hypothetical protein [Phaeobacter phage MD18]|nr:hypothetical protein [Phaeobacter phage MD18]